MARVTIDLGRKLSLIAQGHAEGSPEICAAITCLLYSLGGYLKNACPDRILHWKMESGDVLLECEGVSNTKDNANDKAHAAFLMTAIGLMQLEKRYPRYIRVEMH